MANRDCHFPKSRPHREFGDIQTLDTRCVEDVVKRNQKLKEENVNKLTNAEVTTLMNSVTSLKNYGSAFKRQPVHEVLLLLESKCLLWDGKGLGSVLDILSFICLTDTCNERWGTTPTTETAPPQCSVIPMKRVLTGITSSKKRSVVMGLRVLCNMCRRAETARTVFLLCSDIVVSLDIVVRDEKLCSVPQVKTAMHWFVHNLATLIAQGINSSYQVPAAIAADLAGGLLQDYDEQSLQSSWEKTIDSSRSDFVNEVFECMCAVGSLLLASSLPERFLHAEKTARTIRVWATEITGGTRVVEVCDDVVELCSKRMARKENPGETKKTTTNKDEESKESKQSEELNSTHGSPPPPASEAMDYI